MGPHGLYRRPPPPPRARQGHPDLSKQAGKKKETMADNGSSGGKREVRMPPRHIADLPRLCLLSCRLAALFIFPEFVVVVLCVWQRAADVRFI